MEDQVPFMPCQEPEFEFVEDINWKRDEPFDDMLSFMLECGRDISKAERIGEPIEGNIYNNWAIKGFEMSYAEIVRVCICVVQLLGPFLLIAFQCDKEDWKATTMTRPCHVLAVCLLMLVGAYGSTTLMDDHTIFTQLFQVLQCCKGRFWKTIKVQDATFLQVNGENYAPGIHHPRMFVFSCFMSIYIVYVSSIGMLLNFLAATGPQDLIFNSLAFTFLYKMDDASGDFGSVIMSDTDWSADILGHFWAWNIPDEEEFTESIAHLCSNPSLRSGIVQQKESYSEVMKDNLKPSKRRTELTGFRMASSVLLCAGKCAKLMTFVYPILYILAVCTVKSK